MWFFEGCHVLILMHSQEKRPNSLSPDEVATLMIWISNSHNAVWVVNSAVRVGQLWEKSCKAWSKLENLGNCIGNCMLTIYNISSNFFIELTLNGPWQSETAACRMISGTSCIQKVIQGEKKILGTSPASSCSVRVACWFNKKFAWNSWISAPLKEDWSRLTSQGHHDIYSGNGAVVLMARFQLLDFDALVVLFSFSSDDDLLQMHRRVGWSRRDFSLFDP